jgi:hypothetical protein
MYTHVRVCTRVPASAEQSRADRILRGESAISRERSRVDRDTRVPVHVRDSRRAIAAAIGRSSRVSRPRFRSMCKILVIKCSSHARGNEASILRSRSFAISRFNPLRRCRGASMLARESAGECRNIVEFNLGQVIIIVHARRGWTVSKIVYLIQKIGRFNSEDFNERLISAGKAGCWLLKS